jgi:hypothetical protein
MRRPHDVRLTGMDTSFLVLEKPHNPLHVSATLIYEAVPVPRHGGGIGSNAYRATPQIHRRPNSCLRLRN